jgi:TRAP-type C4-dicarboxylate transport system substrate-binding protein
MVTHDARFKVLPGQQSSRIVVVVRLALLFTTLALLAFGCSGGTKAGGKERQHTVALTIASHDAGDRDLAEYIAAVERLSGDSIRLVLRDSWRPEQVGYDGGILADVRTGKVDLAKIAVRSYDQLGVDDFQALTAPFLVDGLALEQKVLESSLPDEMLPGVHRVGVEGLAMLPGELRRPFGLERRLVGPSDYRGGVIGNAPGQVSALTFRALGATPHGYLTGGLSPWRYDGAELDLETLDDDQVAAIGHSSVTANVAFWPRAFTVVGNRGVLAKLTSEQREILRQAAPEMLPSAIARLRAEDSAEAGVLCRRDHLAFVEATPSQLARLRAAVRPVYARLEQDPKTRSIIGSIRAIKRRSSSLEPAPRCTRSLPRHTAATPLDGTWVMSVGLAQVVAATHVPREDAQVDVGRYRMVLRRGRVAASIFYSEATSHNAGVFVVRRNTVEFRFPDGEDGIYRWNVYRGMLTLRYLPGNKKGAPNPTFAPWRRLVR